MDRDTIGFALLVGGAAAAIISGAVRLMLLPYLREQLTLSRETHQQVTTEHTAPADPPTFREELAEVREEVRAVKAQGAESVEEVAAIGRMFDGHIDRSEDAHGHLQAEVDRLWAELRRRNARHRMEETPRHDHDPATPGGDRDRLSDPGRGAEPGPHGHGDPR
jgi:hypothetical protein